MSKTYQAILQLKSFQSVQMGKINYSLLRTPPITKTKSATQERRQKTQSRLSLGWNFLNKILKPQPKRDLEAADRGQ